MESRLNQVLQIPKRKLIVSLDDITLDKASVRESENMVFVLMVEESPGSAGGRGGGSGNRKIDKIMGFRLKDGNRDVKIFETEILLRLPKNDLKKIKAGLKKIK